MSVDAVSLRNFRNWKNLDLKFSNQLNLLIGLNGQGKTNILESIYLASRAESFRFSNNQSFLMDSESEALVKVRLSQETKAWKDEISLHISKSKKTILINDKKKNSSDLQKILPIVLFSPESLSAIKEGAELRRSLIDEILMSTNLKGVDLIQDFKKCLRTRNKVLKNFKDGMSDLKETQGLLESLDVIFLEKCVDLALARILAMQDMQAHLQRALKSIFNENVDISVEYVISDEVASAWKRENINNSMRKRLETLRSAELASGTSLVGPHKHDIRFLYNQKDSRIYCSQGQQRGLILSFKMAQIVYHRQLHGIDPVLLLDDVLSELDLQKQEALIFFLKQMQSQIILTSTDVQSLSTSLAAHNPVIYKIHQGKVDERLCSI